MPGRCVHRMTVAKSASVTQKGSSYADHHNDTRGATFLSHHRWQDSINIDLAFLEFKVRNYELSEL